MQPRRNRPAEVAVIRPAQPRPAVQAVAGATERRLPGAMEVPIEQVAPDPEQPRRDWGHNDGVQRLEELAASIREFGILQPLLVGEAGTLSDGRQRYVIIAGARRRAAAEQAGLSSVPVLVRDRPSTQVRVLQLIENLQRQDLSPLDEARAYQELSDLESLSPPALAARLHISAQHVRDRLRVLADQVLADAVERRQISASTARDIMKLPDEEIMALRGRVQQGERLQINDIATARARLAAEGIVNPRRKGAPDTTSAPSRPSPAGAEPALTPARPVANGQQTVFVFPGEVPEAGGVDAVVGGGWAGGVKGQPPADPPAAGSTPLPGHGPGSGSAPPAAAGTLSREPDGTGPVARQFSGEVAGSVDWQAAVLKVTDALLAWLREPREPKSVEERRVLRQRLLALIAELEQIAQRLEG